MSPVLQERDTVTRLRDEIALLQDAMDANQLFPNSDSTGERAWIDRQREQAYLACLDAGISEHDAEYPCKAIEARESEVAALMPDRQMVEAGATPLPGFGL